MTLLQHELTEAAREVALAVPADVVDACAAHYALLVRWNKAHNLTRVTDACEAARKHYLDSLVGLAALTAPLRAADVGTGAGFPGVLAALVWRDTEVLLVEPAQKRASFLARVKAELQLENAVVLNVGVDDAPPVPLVLSRATFPWQELDRLHPAVAPGGALAAWVGEEPTPADWATQVVRWGWTGRRQALRVPGAAHRALLMAERPA